MALAFILKRVDVLVLIVVFHLLPAFLLAVPTSRMNGVFCLSLLFRSSASPVRAGIERLYLRVTGRASNLMAVCFIY